MKHISSRTAVMYLGKLAELTDFKSIFARPLHPALLSAVPVPRLDVQRQRIILEGDVPSPINPKPGCRFAGRCALCGDRCRVETPELRELEPGHFVACHRAEELAQQAN